MKNLTILFIALMALLPAICLIAQADEGDSLWTRHYGGSGFEYAYAICPAGDGGFLLAGQTNSLGAGGDDMYLLKVNAQGDSLWSRAYGGSDNDYAYAITPSGDGGFLLAGETNSFDPFEQQTYLVKVNAQGDLLWSRHYGTGADEYTRSIIPSGDGGFLLAGSTNYWPTSYDMWLLKVTALGDSLWSYAYGGYNLQWCYSIAPAGDGNFVLAGSTSQGLNPDQMQLVKVNSQGSELWSTLYGNYYYGDEEAYAMIPSGDGGFLLAGRQLSPFGAGLHDSYAVRVDSVGDTLWTRTFGGVEEDWTNALMPSGDGGFLLAGQTGGYSAGSWDAWLVKVNSQGDSLWGRTYGTNSQEFCRAMVASGDGGYMLAGYTSPDTVAWNWQMYLVKVEGPSTSPVIISLDPLNPPITLPAIGGTFSYNVSVANDTTAAITFDAWIMVRLPNQAWYGPVLGPLVLTLPSGVSLTRQRNQTVPGSAPGGNYLYEGRVGVYPSVVWDSANFPFTKLGTGDWGFAVSGWENYGEEFDLEAQQTPSVPGNFTVSVHPNPFNPSTVISFELRAASYVKLEIFDVNGREVGVKRCFAPTGGRPSGSPLQAWYPAGTHQVTFDGTDLPSGIYFAKLTTGDFSQVQKLVLMK